jgi:nitrilase
MKELPAGEEGILMNEIYLKDIDVAKAVIDTVGYYSRSDFVELTGQSKICPDRD